jgi:hypothetical protein
MWCAAMMAVVVTECTRCMLNRIQFALVVHEVVHERESVCYQWALSEVPDVVHRDGGGRGDTMHALHAQSGSVCPECAQECARGKMCLKALGTVRGA